MKSIPSRLPFLGGILVVIWLFARVGEDEAGTRQTPESGDSPVAESSGGNHGDDGSDEPASSAPEAGLEQVQERMIQAMDSLAGGGLEADEARRILNELRDYLRSLPPEMAALAIDDFLKDGARDSATGLGFVVGENGRLDDPPSLRVALMDWLMLIDLKTAGMVAARTLSAPTQADEWSVSLRNFARANPGSGSFDFLRAKTEELIRNPGWRNKPTVGYFEAFDVLVYSKATESSGLLSELVSDQTPEGRPYAHASFLTLDRLVISEPVEMMEEFSKRPELAESRGRMVANMFARADLREPDQRLLVRQYLLDPKRTRDELEAFAGVYPNNNYSISKNLLTGNDAIGHDDLVAHDRAALDVVESWLGDPAFDPVKPHVETMQKRLVTFVGQANR